MMESLQTQKRGYDITKYSNELPPLLKIISFSIKMVMEQPNMTNKVSLPMFSGVGNLMEALPT